MHIHIHIHTQLSCLPSLLATFIPDRGKRESKRTFRILFLCCPRICFCCVYSLLEEAWASNIPYVPPSWA